MSGTVKVKVELPEGISEQAKETAERSAREATVLSLWRGGEISTRDAATIQRIARLCWRVRFTCMGSGS